MRPWTTRAFQVVFVAAGFTAAGTATAAAEGSAPPMPDLSEVPDTIGAEAPLDTCQPPPGVGHERRKAPCANVNLKGNSPNMVKKVGADIARTSHGLSGELRDDQPLLAHGKPNRTLGHVFAETTRVSHMTKTRPTLSTSVAPGNTGAFDHHTPEGGLLAGKVGPRQPQHQGFSAADTAIDLTAARGYQTEPVANPVSAIAPLAENNPLRTSGPPVSLPRASDVGATAHQVPALASLDSIRGI